MRGLLNTGERYFDSADLCHSTALGRGSQIEPTSHSGIATMFFYVREDRMATLPRAIASTRLRDGEPVPDISPLPFKLRKFLLQRLPYSAQQTLARLKSRVLPDWRI
jgi:hypothetical protein